MHYYKQSYNKASVFNAFRSFSLFFLLSIVYNPDFSNDSTDTACTLCKYTPKKNCRLWLSGRACHPEIKSKIGVAK